MHSLWYANNNDCPHYCPACFVFTSGSTRFVFHRALAVIVVLHNRMLLEYVQAWGGEGGRVFAGARRPLASGYRIMHLSDETMCCSHEAPSRATATTKTPRYTTKIATIHWFHEPRPEGGGCISTPGRWRVPYERFSVRSPPRFSRSHRCCSTSSSTAALSVVAHEGVKRVPRRKGLAQLAHEKEAGWC